MAYTSLKVCIGKLTDFLFLLFRSRSKLFRDSLIAKKNWCPKSKTTLVKGKQKDHVILEPENVNFHPFYFLFRVLVISLERAY